MVVPEFYFPVILAPISGLVKVGFCEFSQIRPTWGVFFRPTVGRAPIISSINERIRILPFQRMSARPKRIRIDEVTIVYMIAQNQKKLKILPVVAALIYPAIENAL